MNIEGIQQNIDLAPYTTFKIGGPAKYFLAAKSKEQVIAAVQTARKAREKWFILGGGSDILISDDGFDGLVIKAEMRGIDFDEEKATVRIDAGLLMAGAIAQSVKRGLGGLEYAVGVPATVGGAIWANLGARGSEIADFLVEATVLDSEGNVQVLSNEECQFTYRDSIFKHEHYIILDGLFQLQKTDKEELRARFQELSQLRNDTQDIKAMCAGCIFKNPTDQTTEAAAKLIDDLGLKGFSIGGAQISETHANFIINTGDATADDVVQLISYIKQQVRDKKGIQLMEEVEYIGF